MGSDSAAFDLVMNGVDNASDDVAKVNKQLDETARKSDSVARASDSASISMTDFNSALQVGKQALEILSDAYQNTIGVSQAYAEQIRNLSAVSGENAESTSRFVQVLDDYQVSAEGAMTATKALTKQGLAPNIDTLAKLSDQYLALNSVEDKNQFVIKNLGRAGLEWTNVLKQGGQALRDQAAAVNQNLILGDKQLKQAEQLRLAQDQLNDTVEGFKIRVGSEATPALTAWVEVLNRASDGTLKSRDGWEKWIPIFGGVINLTETYGDVYNEMQAKLDGATASQENFNQSVEDAAAAQKALEDANKTFISTLNSLQSSEESYTAKSHDLAMQRRDILDAMAATPAWDTTKMQEYQDKLDEIKGKERDLEVERDRQAKAFILNMELQALSANGLTTAEMDALLTQGQAWGVWSAKVVSDTQAAMRQVDLFVQSVNSIPPSRQVNIITNFTTTGAAPGTGQGAAQQWMQNNLPHHAAGGPASVGQTIWAGENGPEPFTAPGSGSVQRAGSDPQNIAGTLANLQATLSNLPQMIAQAQRSNERYVR